MSSGSLDSPDDDGLFRWDASLNPLDYVFVTYEVVSSYPAERTAVAIAMEQSAAGSHFPHFRLRDDIASRTARVVSVEDIAKAGDVQLGTFDLETEIYQAGQQAEATASRLRIAYPLAITMDKPGQWLNVLIGEIPRIGFIAALTVKDIDFPEGILPGPKFGVPGIRRLLDVDRGPLLCRSTRPAVGLDVPEMQRVFLEVLANGFHAVKDDELQSWSDNGQFRSHVEAMVATRKRAEDKAGEKKFYVANLICEPWELNERLEIAQTSGADALLLAPAIQGLGILPAAARGAELPLLAHNAFSEMFVRHPAWGIDPALYAKLLRHIGADWIVTPGAFATGGDATEAEARFSEGARGDDMAVNPSMMIIQGGKNPAGLGNYVNSAGGQDFMLIVASWTDGHPKGLAYAAREFRAAVDEL